jgi:hypothetical protein
MNKELTTKQSFWLGHFQAAQSSGSSFANYTSKHKLNVKALHNWALILRRKGALEHSKYAFVVLKVDSLLRVTSLTLSNHQPVRIFLPNGIRVELPRCLRNLFPKSNASPELMAEITVSKFFWMDCRFIAKSKSGSIKILIHLAPLRPDGALKRAVSHNS